MSQQRQWTHVPGTHVLYADAEQAKSTGGMIALYPRSDYADMLAVPGGEPIEDLHVTLVYLGEDVSGLGDGGLGSTMSQIAGSYSEIDARIFGHAVFNPDGYGDFDPCGVYLIGDSPEMDQLHNEVLQAAQVAFPIPPQHVPWTPHITAGYGNPPQLGQYTGDVVFDRIGFAFGGQTEYYPLLGASITGSYRLTM